MKSSQIHAVAVQKGGVGKSTYANALAYCYANMGYKTVLVDLDPQATQTGAFLGYGYGAFSGDNISNISNIFLSKDIKPIQIKTIKYVDNPKKGKIGQSHYLEEDLYLDFFPSNYELLSMTESDEQSQQEKKDVIKSFLLSLKDEYEKIVIDTPPSFGIITSAIISVTDSILTPIPTKSVDTDGMVGFFRHLDRIFEEQNKPALKKLLIVPNMYDKRLTDAKETLRDIQRTPNLLQQTDNLRELECEVSIPIAQKGCIQEAPSYKMFLVPYIMDFSRSKNFDIVLNLELIAKSLENIKK
jgi:chromosome partitioning protein